MLDRQLRHSPKTVWRALTDPAQLREWAPFDADGNLGIVSMGAAGWHICLDVLDHALDNAPLGRIVGPQAMKVEGWQRLNAEYAKQFGMGK